MAGTDTADTDTAGMRKKMIDLHIHIVPGIDDGAENLEDALEMAAAASDSGVRAAAASSHANLPGRDPLAWKQRYRDRLELLRAGLKKEGIPLEVYPAMELFAGGISPEGRRVFAAAELEQGLDEGSLLTINGSRYPLVEFAFDTVSDHIEQTLKRLIKAGYVPVLAHPERYRCVRRRPDILYRYEQMGVILQVNKGSILGEFGERVRKAAHWILRQRLAGAVASDAHDPLLRTPDLEEVWDALDFHYGTGCAELLLSENPCRILHNKRIIPPR